MASIVSTPRPAPPRAGRPRGFRLRGRAYKLVLTAHILGSVGWFGIAVFVLFAFVVSEATGDRALATGVVLSLGTKWGLVRHWWVVAKILIAIVVIVTDALVIGAAAHDHLVHATSPGDLYGPTIAHTVVLGVATLLSVLKPRGRTPWSRAR